MLCEDFARAFHATMSFAEIGFRVREVEGIDFGVPGTLSGTGHTAVCWQAVSHDCCSQTIPPVRCLLCIRKLCGGKAHFAIQALG